MRWIHNLGGHTGTLLSSARRLVVSHLGGLWPWLVGHGVSAPSGPTAFRQVNRTILFADRTESLSFRDCSEQLAFSAKT